MKTADKLFSFSKRLEEIDMFFAGRGPEHQTLRRLVRKLEKAGIPYVVVGAMAVNAHRHERTTKDVDILLTEAGLTEFRRRFVPKDYQPFDRRPRRFLDPKQNVTIDVLVTGHYPGSGKPGPIAFPDPEQVAERINDVQVVNLATLIQLKLAARRHYDYGDVVHLIDVHNLDESFLPQLHPSVHRDFVECLEEKRRDDEYEKRSDERLKEIMPPVQEKKYPRKKPDR